MGTSRLLVKAKAKGTLPRLNDDVGKGWGHNGETFSTTSGLPRPTHPGLGGPAGAAVLEYYDNPYVPHALNAGTQWDVPDGELVAISTSIPSTKGNFTYDAATDSVKLNWPVNDPGIAKIVKAVEYTYGILNERNTTPNHKPQTEVRTGNLRSKSQSNSTTATDNTYHPLGGAVLGKACDLYGRVKNYQRLYVVDGALMPGSTGCAIPAFTIAAFAERCMEQILAQDILAARSASSRSV